jgi:esterase/lipase
MGKEFLPDIEKSLEINQSACAWTARALALLKERLSVNIKLHDPHGAIGTGQIFLFNHFARFETVIPQFLIHRETGAYCRSVASSEFFAEDNRFSRYLRGLGAVPNNHPRLLPFLAAEILRGRRVVIFPEGGMVKDRLVIDENGEYSVYSRAARQRRKHHSGAAVLALTLDAFKTGILELHRSGNTGQLERWSRLLGLESVDALLAAARQPTKVVPANITFFPIRISEHFMSRAMGLFGGRLPSQFSEEMLIEGNILLKNTDMDIRLGRPVLPVPSWSLLHRKAFGRFVREKSSMDEMFSRATPRDTPVTRLVRWFVVRDLARRIEPLRDAYMREMYARVTVNLGHFAASLVMNLIERGETRVSRDRFNRMLYLSIKNAQRDDTVALHRGLRNPAFYLAILDNTNADLEQQLTTASRLGLLQRGDGHYTFLPTLLQPREFDSIRIKNPVVVAANEIKPVPGAIKAVHDAIDGLDRAGRREWAMMTFDDMRIRHAWDKARYAGKQYAAINELETATESGEPYLLLPEDSNGLGVVLVHGFLASPAELREFGERLAALGHPVIGIRLAGHGTSPWDLREQTWQDWLEPVREGYRIMSAFADRLCLVGFSTGGSLSLMLAAERPPGLAGTIAVSAALKFRNRNIAFVPVLHGANRMTGWLPSYEGVMPFRVNESEHPTINYRHIPIRALFELRRLVDEMQGRLPDVICPVALFQGSSDPIVDPKSADAIFARLGTTEKWLHRVASRRHGILNENIDNTQERVVKFLGSVLLDRMAA